MHFPESAFSPPPTPCRTPGILRCRPVIHALHFIGKQTCLALDLTLMAAESGINLPRFDSFNGRTFNTNPNMDLTLLLQAHASVLPRRA
jgi:hypothetical protein